MEDESTLNWFAIVTLIVIVILIIYLVIIAVYVRGVSLFVMPAQTESNFIFWTTIVVIVLLVIFGIIAIYRLFSYRTTPATAVVVPTVVTGVSTPVATVMPTMISQPAPTHALITVTNPPPSIVQQSAPVVSSTTSTGLVVNGATVGGPTGLATPVTNSIPSSTVTVGNPLIAPLVGQ